MSEYQFVHFMALDGPLDDDALEFMQRQSSRADVTRYSFTNEYHYGSFRGDAHGMLRRGFDVHLHFANYGIRFLMFRLPALPCDKKTFKVFSKVHGLEWTPDKKGTAGILSVQPEGDDRYYDYLQNPDGLLDRLAPVRDMLVRGDLRPLYLFWLACVPDDDDQEPPVPAGLNDMLGKKCPDALDAIAEFYLIPEELIRSAATTSPDTPDQDDAGLVIRGWLQQQNKTRLQTIAESLLLGDVAERKQLTSLIHREAHVPEWPMAAASRTFGQIEHAALDAEKRIEEQAEAERAVERQIELQAIAENPKKVIRRIDACVKSKQRTGYKEAAAHLTELGEAMGPEFAQQQADRLMQKYPRYSALRQEVRTAGFDV